MFKHLRYLIFKLIYGKIDKVIIPQKSKKIILKKITLDNSIKYNFYNILNGRVYSDSVNNTAYISDDFLVKDASYQYKLKKNLQTINGDIFENFVIKNGTPKLLKKINGTVFSILSGGAAKNNYWHWIFDSIPKIAIAEKLNLKKKIDFYLLPSLKKKYQLDTLLMLNIQDNKLLDGEKNKHIACNNLLAVDHPYVLKNNPSNSIMNIPNWIIKWLRKKYNITKSYSNRYQKKIYINRESDSDSNDRKIINNEDVKHLLSNQGFEIVTLSNYDFKDQVKMFNNASQIVGLHGAGFANLVFSKPNTKVIELCGKHSGNVISNLGKTCRLNYKKIIDNSSKINKHQNNPLKVDLKKLKKMIMSFN
tara:strand:- start:239 stop:1327 length:1089 start_codon:yes stop_codon:yes gene_type:complete